MIWKCIYQLDYRVNSDWTCQRSLLVAPKYVIKYQYLVFVFLFTSTHRACNFRKWRKENKQKYIHWILLRNHNGTDQAQINNKLQNKKQSQMTRMYLRVLRAEQLFPSLRPRVRACSPAGRGFLERRPLPFTNLLKSANCLHIIL